MKIFSLLLFYWFLLSTHATAQSPVIDSLRTGLANNHVWKEQIDIMRSIGYEFHGLNIDSSMYYGNQMLRISEAHDYVRGRGLACQLIGESYLYKGQNEKGLEYLQRSEVAFRACGEKKLLITVLANTSYALELQNRFGEAGDKLITRIEISNELKDSTDLAEAYRNFASILVRQGRADDALGYLRKGLAIWSQKKKNPHYFYSQIGEVFYALHQQDSALHYMNIALAAAEQTNAPRHVALVHNNLGRVYFAMGNYAQAQAHYLEALAYFEKVGSNINLPNLYNNLAENENACKNYQKAIEYAKKAQNYVGNKRNFSLNSMMHYNLYRGYEGLGDYPAALRESLLWKSAVDSLNKDDNARKVAEVESRFHTREQQATITQQQLQLERQQNRQRLLLLLALLLLGAGVGLALFLRSRRQRAELALRIQTSEALHLRELDQMKSAFFANISHEFRTPLTLILAPLRELEQGVFKGNPSKYFGMMRRNAERLLQLINQLLDLSRLESGKLQLQPQPGDLRSSLRVMAHAFESLAEQRQVHYGIVLPDSSVPVYFDRDKLEIIIANLLSNAFKFTPEEGWVQLEVQKIPGSGDQTWIKITVSDSGMGIPAGQQEHIFDRFYQVENSGSDLQPGSGIGLALTKEIVHLFGGTIALESPVPGQKNGAAFTVTLPLRPVTDLSELANQPEVSAHYDLLPSQETLPHSEQAAGHSSARHQPIVLIVEDNRDVRTYVSEQLRGQCRILEASDGQSAFEMAKTELPDLILSDLMMPVLDGIGLIRLLKEDERTSHIPVILLTAKAGQPDRLKGLETGAEAYLTKPFDAEELRLVVTKTIAQRQVLKEKFSREIRLGLSNVSATSLDDLFLQKILACIEENLDDDLFGVEQLAKNVNMSRSNLFRKLDALTGKSPTNIIRELRLTRAKSLLEQGAGNTTEVAFMVGFNTPAYFVKCFTDEYGISPGELRKKASLNKQS